MASEVQEVPRIPETIDFPSEELKILSLWKDLDAFQACLRQSEGKRRYTFYDGPPFATGLPHYGHILAGTIKDIRTRFAHQQGRHVERRFGWDCHGLPVEFEIDKALGIKSSQDVKRMGLDKYNGECRKIVTRYVEEWKLIMGRIGRWVDFDNDYKTMYPWFMESVWWVFKQLFLKGFVYHGNKIMPYSTACHTPLSNFESGQNYKEVTDPAVTVALPIIGDQQGAAMLVWTTTPWTLPSNLAACVNPKLTYARVRETSTGGIYILLKSRANSVFNPDDYEVLDEFPGKHLKGLKYEPIFPYYSQMSTKGAFTVLTDDYVNSESGTGIVHQAPYFGEDDFRVCLAAGIVTCEQEPICPVDADGRLTNPITDFEGQYFKEADKNIIAALKAKKRLVRSSQVKHSYPYCWRSDTPLIYKAIPSWFIRVLHMSELLQRVSSETYWVPPFVKEKRFGNWLKEARDWAVSRNRYWGTPIPIWASPDWSEICCVGSIAELEELTGTKITDLHCESIDHLLIPSRIPGNPPLRRIPEVFDCWFESGAMPYAQQHFPFENQEEFSERFPADFVAEGIDQTRGWFYTLLVISTALFGKAPYKFVLASGLILAGDGQKMSKRKKNYPDPMEVVSKYGADALRLYLINSPAVRAENLCFKEEGVREVVKNVFLPWFNAFRFLMQNIEMYVGNWNEPFCYEGEVRSSNIMDRWIVSLTQSLLSYVHQEITYYWLADVVPRLIRHFEHLTNWYVRMNRKRLKGEIEQSNPNTLDRKNNHRQALLTLFNVLISITIMMAPFVPFFSEYIYQHLKKFTSFASDSVHFLMFPETDLFLINRNIERKVSRLQEIVELGRILRDRKVMPIKYPLPEIVVIHQHPQYLSDIASLEQYVLSEMNVRKLTLTSDKEQFGIKLRAKPDYKALGMLKKKVALAIEALTDADINELIEMGHLDLEGIRVEMSMVRLVFQAENFASGKYAMEIQRDVLVLLDVNPDESMQDEGAAREIVNRIQKLRKKAHLVPSDMIDVYYKATNHLEVVARSHLEFIKRSIKTNFVPIDLCSSSNEVVIEESGQFKGSSLRLLLTKKVNVQVPWVNVLVWGFKEQSKGLVLLEAANEVLGFEGLKSNIKTLFHFYSEFDLWGPAGQVTDTSDIARLTGGTVLAVPQNGEGLNYQDRNESYQKILSLESGEAFCKFLNFCGGGVCGTIVLENPVGTATVGEKDYRDVINQWIKKAGNK